MRAVIADDEYKVCQLIEQLGDWEPLGIEIAAVCGDGEEALAAIERIRPEIVITDIRMPVYDGLELIKRTREEGLTTEFIVISGYRQFEYAYGAIQYGVSDYLLKPIDREQLNAALKKICGKYYAKENAAAHEEKLEQLETEQAAWGEKQLLSGLMEGTFAPEQLPDYRKEWHVPLEEGLTYQAMVLNTNQPRLHLASCGFGEKAVETVKQQFQAAAYIAAASGLYGVVCLLGYQPEQYPLITQDISHVFSQVRALRDFYGDFDLAVGLGAKVEGPGRLLETVNSAKCNEKAKLVLGWNKIIERVLHSGIDMEGKGTWAVPEQMKRLDDALDRFDREAVGAWFDGWLRHVQTQRVVCFADFTEGREAVLKRLTVYYDEDERFELVLMTDRARGSRDFICRLKDAAVDGLDRYRKAKESEETRPIRLARDYIAKNYARPLTLEELASYVGFSAVYFSTLFKKLTGQSFADYLTQVRLDEAKRLLKEGDKSILEISAAVGYGDNKYFRKLFKKMTGMRPSDYRKLYS